MSERERDALTRAVTSVMPLPALGYQHPATVQTQSIVDGNVSVSIEDGGPLPGASDVPCVYGLPGVECKMPQGTRARIEFDNGDPRRRTFGAYDAGCPVTEIKIAAPNDSQKAARAGDTVLGSELTWEALPPAGMVPTGGILTLRTPQPAGSPEIGITQWLVTGPVTITQIFPPSESPAMKFDGIISGGSSVVKIGG